MCNPSRAISKRLKTWNHMRGYSIVHFLTFLCLSSICVATILKTEMSLFKKLKNDTRQEHLDNSVNHCLSGILAYTNNSTKLKGINLSHWHDSISSINENTKKIIINKNAIKRIAKDSAILETSQVRLPIYVRNNQKNNDFEYLSSYQLAFNKTQEAYNTFLLLNHLSDIMIYS